MSQLVVSLILFLVAYEMWKHYTAKKTCLYCGKYRSHEVHCPYSMLDQER